MPPNIEAPTTPSTGTFITERQFQDYIKRGDSVFIYENKVYKVNNFKDKHPGGLAAIACGLGKDATDEIRAFHPPKVYQRMINLYYIGDYLPALKSNTNKNKNRKTKKKSKLYDATNSDQRKQLEATWDGGMSVTAFNNAIEELYSQHEKGLKKQDAAQKHLDTLKIRHAYWQLKQEVTERDLFKCNYWNYAKDVCRFMMMIYLSMWFTFNGTDTWHYMLGATFLSVFWHQLVFPAHDAGHNEITGNSNIDHVIGVLIANFIGGLSLGWWKDNHNVHHIATNHPEHDPDIQHLPFLAITTKLFTNIFSTYYKRVLPFDAVSKFFVRRQHYLYYLVLSFGRFNLHRLSFIYLFTTPNVRTRKLELIGITFFFIWFGKLLSMLPNWKIRSAYVMISYMLTFPLHVQITLAHFGMSTEDMGPSEPFAAKMIRTTMDIETPECVDWFYGGLQYQTVHHLFPRLPRHNYRMCLPFVRQFCKNVGLHYYMYNLSTGNGIVLGGMKVVADQVDLLNKVAKSNAEIWSSNKHV